MKTQLRRLFFLSMLILAACNDASPICVPASKLGDLQSENIQVVDWKLNITDDVTARVIVGNNGEGELTPRLVLFDTLNRKVSVTTMEKFPLSPLYTVWIDNEISKKGTDGKRYTTIYTIGYLPADIYPNRHIFSVTMTFQPEERKEDSLKQYFYRTGEFGNGVFWFPSSNLDYGRYGYTSQIRVDTEESLATNYVMSEPGVLSEWAQEYDPALNVDDFIVKMSRLDWADIDSDTECGLSL